MAPVEPSTGPVGLAMAPVEPSTGPVGLASAPVGRSSVPVAPPSTPVGRPSAPVGLARMAIAPAIMGLWDAETAKTLAFMEKVGGAGVMAGIGGNGGYWVE